MGNTCCSDKRFHSLTGFPITNGSVRGSISNLQRSLRVVQAKRNKQRNIRLSKDTPLECLVCKDVKSNSLITSCCSRVVCVKWAPRLNKCPLKCTQEPLSLLASKKLLKIIRKTTKRCEFCSKKYRIFKRKEHLENCCKKLLTDTIVLDNLHEGELKKEIYEVNETWFCACRGSLSEDHLETKGVTYVCENCNIRVCRTCALKAMKQTDINRPILVPCRYPSLERQKLGDLCKDFNYTGYYLRKCLSPFL